MRGAPISDAAIARATGRNWARWQAVLRKIKAAALPHREIAARLNRDFGVPGWWAQALTVRFEREIGRRAVGEVAPGAYSASASKTLPDGMDAALRAWLKHVGGARQFDDVAFAGPAKITRTPKWRYWRVALADGSRVVIGICDKPDGKALLGVGHEKLESAKALSRWKAFWRAYLVPLGK